jgi:hypothetical protein
LSTCHGIVSRACATLPRRELLHRIVLPDSRTMDCAILQKQLAEARIRIVQGEHEIARQMEIITSLECQGRDASAALEVLNSLLATQGVQEAQRDGLLMELAQT